MSPMTPRPLDIELALLGYVRSGPQHGYQIMQQACARAGLGGIWRIKKSQVYALLDKLEKAGYLDSRVDSAGDGAARRYYELTEAGRKQFLAWIITPAARPFQMRQLFMARLFFALGEERDTAIRLIQAQQAMCAAWRTELQGSPDAVPGFSAGAGVPAYARLVNSYRLAHVEMISAWLETCLKTLERQT